jgi:CDP-glycerol glycerophosphotransferase
MKLKKWVRKTYMYLCYVTRPRKEKSVFFASFRGQYSDNPRAISECLHRMAPDVKIVWLVKPQYRQYVPDYVTVVPPRGRRALKAQARATVWVLNYTYRKHLGVYKGRDNYYIQTWHGDRGLKTIGYLTGFSKEKKYCGYDLTECDLFVAASDYGVKKARQGLLYEGEVIVEGMPRNDKLVNIGDYGEEVARIKKSLGIDNNVKVMLYAPTFRENSDQQQCVIDIASSIAALESLEEGERGKWKEESGKRKVERRKEKWICLVRSHSLTKKISTGSDSTTYLDVSSYPDMADLLLIADLLLTDYSSCAGDFLLTARPVVLVHFDRNDYEAQGRPLWVKPEEAGYLVAKNQGELNQILSKLY